MTINLISPYMLSTTYANANVAVGSNVVYSAATESFTVTTS